MKEKFDENIKNKVEDFINTNKVPYNPEHWQMLLAKKKKAKKRTMAYWRWAAVLVLFILAGGVATMLYETEIPTPTPTQTQTIVNSEKDTVQQKNKIEEVKEKQIATAKENEVDKNYKVNTIKNKFKSRVIASKFKKEKAVQQTDEKQLRSIQNTQIKEEVFTKQIAKTTKHQKETQFKKGFENKTNNLNVIAEKENKTVNLKEQLKNNKTVRSKHKKRFMTLGVNASPMLSYTANIGNTFGYSGGVSVEIPLTKSIDVQAELVYANHTMDYLDHRGSGLMYANNDSYVVHSENSLASRVDLSSKESTVNMIEIPISVKYHFKMQEQKLFVSAGFASTSVLKEKVDSKYNVSERIVKNTPSLDGGDYSKNVTTYEYVTSQQVVSTKKNFNNFYPIGAVQMSFGGEFQVGKSQSIVVEPYYKHFIRPITSRNTTFSNVGVRLQYRFNLKK